MRTLNCSVSRCLNFNNYSGETLDPESKKMPPKKKTSRLGAPFLLIFILMFLSWIVLSGKFDLFHLSLGVVSCLLVAYFSSDLLFQSVTLGTLWKQWARFLMYLPWLIYQIFRANIHVMILVFHPRMMDLIDPRIIKFRSKLKGEIALVTFANSITLTPGTITVYVTEYADFEVHVIDQPSAESLPGDMETRIANIFMES